jgi:hypothetical protein
MTVKSFTIKTTYNVHLCNYFNVFLQHVGIRGLKLYIERTFKIVPHKHKYEIRNQVISRQ